MGSDIDDVPAKPLGYVGLDGPETVACIAVRWQIAQKLHACTERLEGRTNDRFRDLLDLQLLSSLVNDHEWDRVKTACTEVFALRGLHEWPPTLTIPDPWVAGYRTLAGDIGFTVVRVEDAAAAVKQLIDRIDRA